MYRVLKSKGHNANVILENTDTTTTIIIGRITMEILEVLEGEGYKFDTGMEGSLKLTDEWELNVTEDTGKILANTAMKMSKPIRTQGKAKSEQKTQDANKHIDAMDVLLGLASYS